MIDPQRLIGGLLNGALDGNFGKKKKKGKHSKGFNAGSLLGGANKAAIGMGLLGLAFAAMEHFQQKPGGGFGGGQPFPGTTPPGGGPSTPPPPPPVSAGPPPPPPPSQAAREHEAMLILRAMVAAANADYAIDPEERENILTKAREAGLSEEEMRLVAEELDHPKSLADVVRAVQNPQQAEEVYVASLLAIDVDSEAEKAYLRALADRLKLPEETVARWNEQFGEAAA